MKKLEIIVVGSGRCGTGYISKVLTSAGVPCGHEGVFGFLEKSKRIVVLDEKQVVKNMRGTDFVADSSWLAVPFLYPDFPLVSKDTIVVHLVRNPIKVINSFCKFNFFAKRNKYSEFAYSHLDQLDSKQNQYENAIRWYIGWNKMIEERGSVFDFFIRHRVEDDVKILLKNLKVDFRGKRLFGNLNYNKSYISKNPVGERNHIKRAFSKTDRREEMLDMIKKYGYMEKI